jgi:hypothetical protein
MKMEKRREPAQQEVTARARRESLPVKINAAQLMLYEKSGAHLQIKNCFGRRQLARRLFLSGPGPDRPRSPEFLSRRGAAGGRRLSSN